jgi:hypothetical protein
MRLKTFLVLALPFLALGCGGGSSSTPAPGPLSGNWQITLQPSNYPKVRTWSQAGFLTEEKNTITGTVVQNAPACFSVGPVNGTIKGSDVNLTVTPLGFTVNMTGTVTSDSATMSGDYNVVASGCGPIPNDPLNGTWTGNLVSPIKGNLQGTLTSQQGPVITVTATAKQGQPLTGSTNAPVSGTLTVTSPYCFSSAPYSGTISGTTVVMNMLNPDNTQLGQITGTLSLDGTTLSGKYTINPLGPDGALPCRSGDTGSVALSTGS